MKGIVVVILGLVALGVVLAATFKWYRKYQDKKTGPQLKEEQDKRL